MKSEVLHNLAVWSADVVTNKEESGLNWQHREYLKLERYLNRLSYLYLILIDQIFDLSLFRVKAHLPSWARILFLGTSLLDSLGSPLDRAQT